ncbi:MAG TPA: HAMP domain-containing sensor histidine kinase [Candidatus Limnocylindrales bacterium]|nr:HAMP domain-containing sensor histidine kinase [Candidatus Limnocylindrales bacterium]
MPRTFQARLTLAFVGVVALTLGLVSIFVLNRLDDYFTQQQAAQLQERAKLVAQFVDETADSAVNPPGSRRRPVVAGDQLDPAAALRLRGSVEGIANFIAQSDVEILLAIDPGEGGALVPVATFTSPITIRPSTGTQEPLVVGPVSQYSSQSVDPYVIAVRLSNPYTFRQTTLANVTSLLAAVGVVALGLAMIVAAAVAHRFTTPLRRLTEASRSLAEGDFTQRIKPEDVRAGSSELTELAVQFNAMAEKLEQSVSIIRSDRDRSRDFLADVSHELRTPIAALLTFNELLKDQAGDDPAARAEFLESSRVQLERLDWLAQNLLELSKLESGLVLLDLRPDDLRAAVESSVEQAQQAARRRKIDLHLSLPEGPLRVRHDPQRIGQVVNNLVGNAIKFTPPGGRVDVVVAPNGDGARIDVVDTGTGIDPSELPRIFDRFYRGSRANEARGSGSGLGLAIVHSIVDMHHGTIAVDSRLGAGSRFTVLLPNDPRTADTPPPADQASSAGSTGSATEPTDAAGSAPIPSAPVS